jgi:hypothetical protein
MPGKLLSQTKVLAGAFVVLAAVALPRSANAQIISFQGFTNGCFGACNVALLSTSALQTASAFSSPNQNVLRYQNSQFNVNVPNGSTVNLNAAPTPIGTQNVNNFGAFYVQCGRSCSQTLNTTFDLMITLTSPTSSQIIFNGLLTGFLNKGAQGFNLVFTNTPANVTWSAGAGPGSAIITVNNVSANGGVDLFNVSGSITAQVTPEPATMFLFGTGLFGLLGAARRRRKNSTN